MKKIFFTVLCSLVFLFGFGQDKITEGKIDAYLKEVIEVNEIPGAAVAVIKNGKIIYEKYFGESSLENQKPVDQNTGFRLFSTTKIITNVAIFQLIENGKLSLEDPISKYLFNLPKEWQDIKVGNLLSHSSGLPNIVAFDDIPISLPYEKRIEILATKPMEFITGNEYRYNQTNYLFLTRIIEKITGQTFDEYILQNQFPNVKSGVTFSSNMNDVFANGGVRYTYDAKTKKYQKGNTDFGKDSHSANGMIITLPEFIRWNQNLDKNIFLKEDTKSLMWKPFKYASNSRDFAYGWEIYNSNNTTSFGFTGGNETAFRKFLKDDITIIFLSNGHKYSGMYVQSQVINHVAGLIDSSLVDDHFLAHEKVNYDFLKLDIQKAIENYKTLKASHPEWDFEYRLNVIGYTFLNYGRINDAIKVFELNSKENPQSGNAFDSLADAYFNNKQFELSKQNYQKALALSPDNNNAKEMLKKLDGMIVK
ncbi:serine hydrolase domain-containing protein [Flavobacterium quisquiliarum]|uniref:Serine hydrolase n=1 Tax=Flavobacterium quisquiliarum TaxID=1834436 RepID=A0ABV8WD77_9FLAO|nr:serine hydrolase domain-containing protein [Flavobacterium quisquiliarum]MBW1655706.1 serine hydrolase [Flavobacterium quisquiliarum]NWK99983.1 serine hydrolase [Flavobacterium collinsii]